VLDGVVKHLEEFGCDGVDSFVLGKEYGVDFSLSQGRVGWSLGLVENVKMVLFHA
jgi:hypothetical protein